MLIDSCLFWISLDQSSLLSPSGTYIHWADVPRALSGLGWTVQLSLSPCTIPFTCSNISTSHQCCGEGKHHLPWPAGSNLPHAAQGAASLLYFSVLLAHDPWSCSTWCAPRAPDLFLQSCFPVAVAPSLHRCYEVIPSQDWALSFGAQEFIKLLLTYFSYSLSWFIWMKHKHLVYHSFCLLFCSLQTFRRCSLSHYHVINCNVKQYWSQYLLAGYSTSDWPAAGNLSACSSLPFELSLCFLVHLTLHWSNQCSFLIFPFLVVFQYFGLCFLLLVFSGCESVFLVAPISIYICWGGSMRIFFFWVDSPRSLSIS